jgi:hypothetical protein
MTSTPTMTSSHAMSPFSRGSFLRRSDTDRHLLFVAELYVLVLIVETIFIAMAAPTIADIGSLYITVT